VCCDDWQGFTLDMYDPDGDGIYELNHGFIVGGDAWDGFWQVHDAGHPFCAYGAQAYELTIWVGANGWGNPVWQSYVSYSGCCPFESRAPENQIEHSGIFWDGTINTGFWNCNGCYVTTGTYYAYELRLIGCGGEAVYTGLIYAAGDTDGLAQAPLVPLATLLAQQDSSMLVGQQTTPLSEPDTKQPVLRVYPNPGNTDVTIGYPLGISRMMLMDATGRALRDVPANGAASITLEVSDLATASYLLRVKDSQGATHYRTLIKQ